MKKQKKDFKNYILMIWLKRSEPLKVVTHLDFANSSWRAEDNKDPYVFKSRTMAEDIAFGMIANGIPTYVIEVYHGLPYPNRTKFASRED